MSNRLNNIISLIGCYDHEEDNYIRAVLKEEIFDDHIWWLVEEVKQLQSENERLQNEYEVRRVELLEEHIERLESENEQLHKRIELAKDALEPYAVTRPVQTAFKYLRGDSQ